MKHILSYGLVSLFGLFLCTSVASAQAGCSRIAYFADDGGIESASIADCENPFAVEEAPSYTPKLTYAGEVVEQNDTLSLPRNFISQRLLDTSDTALPSDFYGTRLFKADSGGYFEQKLIQSGAFSRPELGFEAGVEYIMLFQFFEPQLSVLDRVRSLFVPAIAHAQATTSAFAGELATISFTIDYFDVPVEDCGLKVAQEVFGEEELSFYQSTYGIDAITPLDNGKYVYSESSPIRFCDDPFGSRVPIEGKYDLLVNGQVVNEGDTVTVPSNATNTTALYQVGGLHTEPQEAFVWRKEGDNLVTLARDLSLPEAPYISLEVGEYIAVITGESVLGELTKDTISFVVQTETIDPQPLGASSVLFLPGIMGSSLYEESAVCDNEVKEQKRWFSTSDCEQLRLLTDFTGSSANDIYTKNVQNAVIDEILTQNLYKTFLSELDTWKDERIIDDYRAIAYDWRLKLEDILSSKVDPSNGQVRYVAGTDIAESYLYEILNDLAEDSLSGKVSIVTHSNGGLVAKAFIQKLELANDPLLAKIDRLILVAVPQVGTPESLISILQGSELGPAGLVVSQSTSRRLLNTAPFSHHLLPNQSYFEMVSTPTITFGPGSITDVWRSQFGVVISDSDVQQSFLSKDSGRSMPDWSDLSEPATVDNFLLSYANITEQKFRSWTPPSSIMVYQIAGTGLPTPTGITYFTDQKCVSRSVIRLFTCDEYEDKLGYRVNVAVDGDETVVTPSALAMYADSANVENVWLDLYEYNTSGIAGLQNANRKHKNILEVDEIISFVKNTISEVSGAGYQYLNESAPDFSDQRRLLYTLHSPLDMLLLTESGEISSSSDAIAGAVYKRYGEVQYISVPKDVEGDKTLLLLGQSTGSFTLEVEEFAGADLISRQSFSAIPSSTSTKVTVKIEENFLPEELKIEVDYNGDGSVDVEYNKDGEVMAETEGQTYEDLYTAINALSVQAVYKKYLLRTAQRAERFYNKAQDKKYTKHKTRELFMLRILKKQVLFLNLFRVVSNDERDRILEIVDYLATKN